MKFSSNTFQFWALFGSVLWFQIAPINASDCEQLDLGYWDHVPKCTPYTIELVKDSATAPYAFGYVKYGEGTLPEYDLKGFNLAMSKEDFYALAVEMGGQEKKKKKEGKPKQRNTLSAGSNASPSPPSAGWTERNNSSEIYFSLNNGATLGGVDIADLGWRSFCDKSRSNSQINMWECSTELSFTLQGNLGNVETALSKKYARSASKNRTNPMVGTPSTCGSSFINTETLWVSGNTISLTLNASVCEKIEVPPADENDF
jgi:hypothetical protein